jgi:hypothetical protein
MSVFSTSITTLSKDIRRPGKLIMEMEWSQCQLEWQWLQHLIVIINTDRLFTVYDDFKHCLRTYLVKGIILLIMCTILSKSYLPFLKI